MSNFIGDSQKIKNLYCNNLYLSSQEPQDIKYPDYLRYNTNSNNFEGYIKTDESYTRDTNNGWVDFGIKKADKYIEYIPGTNNIKTNNDENKLT